MGTDTVCNSISGENWGAWFAEEGYDTADSIYPPDRPYGYPEYP